MEFVLTAAQRREFDQLSVRTPVPPTPEEFMQKAIEAGLKEWRERLTRWESARNNEQRWQRHEESVTCIHAMMAEAQT